MKSVLIRKTIYFKLTLHNKVQNLILIKTNKSLTKAILLLNPICFLISIVFYICISLTLLVFLCVKELSPKTACASVIGKSNSLPQNLFCPLPLNQKANESKHMIFWNCLILHFRLVFTCVPLALTNNAN